MYQSQIGRLQLIFFFSLFGLALVLTLHTIHCKVTFTCVLSDPREKIRTIPRLQKPSPDHLLFLHWRKLFFLTSVLIPEGIWGCPQPLTLVPYIVTSTPGVLGGC